MENRGTTGKILEKWLASTLSDKHSRTASISCKNKRFFLRISHYFEHYNDGLDARGEGNCLRDASRDAVLHFHQLLWKQIVRRSNNVKLNQLKHQSHDLILKEMKEVQKKDFSTQEWLKEEEYRNIIFKNNDVLELNKDNI